MMPRGRFRAAGTLRDAAVAALVMWLALASAVPALARPQGPGRHGTEFIDVVPSNDLRGDESVMVSGTGFPPNAGLALTECLAVADDQDDCDLSTLDLGVKADADGSFGLVPFTVHPVIRVGSRTGPVTCGTDACSVGVGTLDALYGGSHCLGFGGRCRPTATPGPSAPGPRSAPPSAPATPTTQPSGGAAGSGSGSGGSGIGVVAAIIAAAVVIGLIVVGLLWRRSRAARA